MRPLDIWFATSRASIVSGNKDIPSCPPSCRDSNLLPFLYIVLFYVVFYVITRLIAEKTLYCCAVLLESLIALLSRFPSLIRALAFENGAPVRAVPIFRRWSEDEKYLALLDRKLEAMSRRHLANIAQRFPKSIFGRWNAQAGIRIKPELSETNYTVNLVDRMIACSMPP
jgi:hypothetical protein